tara:strand:- start:553 stop:1386 length:834 start_codon:yes stop_codon:yes gene_type:complete
MLIFCSESFCANIVGTIKKIKNQKALIFLETPMEVSPGATLKTSVSGVSFLVNKVSPQKTRLIGTFTSSGVLEKGEEVQFIGVEAVAVEEVEEYSEESEKKVDEGFRVGDYRIHLYGATQLPAEMTIAGASSDISLGLGAGVEFVQEFSFSESAQFGLGFGGEGYMPQSSESGGVEFVDILLPMHGYLNTYYYLPMSEGFELSVFAGGLLSLQNYEHKNLSGQEMSMSIGAQFGLGFNFDSFELRGLYRMLNHELETSVSTVEVDYNNIVFTLGYNF